MKDERAGAEAKESHGSSAGEDWGAGAALSISCRICRPRSLVIMAVMCCRSDAKSWTRWALLGAVPAVVPSEVTVT